MVDLSKAMKLKEVLFTCKFPGIEWVTATLETATKLQDLQRISIYVRSIVTRITLANGEEQTHTPWSDLDPLLIQFWESHSIRTKVSYPPQDPEDEGRGGASWYKHMLPESSERGVINLVEGYW